MPLPKKGKRNLRLSESVKVSVTTLPSPAMFAKAQRVHFIGIGGIGMSGIAEILLNLGYAVSGSDLRQSSITDRLVSLGATVFAGHAGNNRNADSISSVSDGEKQPIGTGRMVSGARKHESLAGVERRAGPGAE